jgi:hypothetical protein
VPAENRLRAADARIRGISQAGQRRNRHHSRTASASSSQACAAKHGESQPSHTVSRHSIAVDGGPRCKRQRSPFEGTMASLYHRLLTHSTGQHPSHPRPCFQSLPHSIGLRMQSADSTCMHSTRWRLRGLHVPFSHAASAWSEGVGDANLCAVSPSEGRRGLTSDGN